MTKRRKDTDYLFLSARIRAMERRLLTAQRLEQLLTAPSVEACAQLLSAWGYGHVHDEPYLHAALGAQSVCAAGRAVRGEDRGGERGGERRDSCNEGGQSSGNEVEPHRRGGPERRGPKEDFGENRPPFPDGAERAQTPRGPTGAAGNAAWYVRNRANVRP